MRAAYVSYRDCCLAQASRLELQCQQLHGVWTHRGHSVLPSASILTEPWFCSAIHFSLMQLCASGEVNFAPSSKGEAWLTGLKAVLPLAWDECSNMHMTQFWPMRMEKSAGGFWEKFLCFKERAVESRSLFFLCILCDAWNSSWSHFAAWRMKSTSKMTYWELERTRILMILLSFCINQPGNLPYL